uniref:Uncharacterized protein n=1 Tax=Candidatus Kentrum sp. DK TaxID=2126562 RepID=A0A450RTT7_9GAMM|nr:MAG: hypothetical protein BECKDK2373C_GA0170839_100146 [Candidatus Kentron sp. DK]
MLRHTCECVYCRDISDSIFPPDNFDYQYEPVDAYFAKLTRGWICKCEFCAVPKLEPEFGALTLLEEQVAAIKAAHETKQHLYHPG